MSKNGCAHVNTEIVDDDGDSVIICKACGEEMSRTKKSD